MKGDRPNLTVDAIIRQVLLALVFLVLQLYLSPLISWWAVLGWHLAGLVLLYRLGSPAALLTVPAAGVIVWALPVLGYRLGVFGPGSGVESFIIRGRYTVPILSVPALIPILLEVWYYRFRRHRTYFPLIVAAVSVLLFWSQGHYRTELFSHPVWYILTAVPAAVLLASHQAVVSDDELGLSGRARMARVLAVILVITAAAFPVYTLWGRGSVEAGGGLIRPSAFHFDFSDFVSLESDIRVSRGLVLLYREDSMPAERLLRRYVLSGYDRNRGFFRLDSGDEPSPVPPRSVSRAADGTGIPPAPDPEAVTVEQEYYLLNFDPDALLGVHNPVAVRTIADWDRTSFSSAYQVRSIRPGGAPEELQAVPWPDIPDRRWRSAYLGGDIPDSIAALAREVVPEEGGYYETVAALERYFLENFHYSLSPGVSPTGDQLSHFLFESRKGYCSYFAFSMTLMARSLGIPARVALGFFTDPQSGVLGFYPVRGDMAHAWVEVWFEGVGWVEFDPTSQRLAPGEEFSFDTDGSGEELAGLVEEILANRREGFPFSEELSPPDGDGGEGFRRSSRVSPWFFPAVILLAVMAGPLYVHYRNRRFRRILQRSPRQAARELYQQTRKRYDRMVRWGMVTTPVDFSVPARLGEPFTGIGELVDRSRYAETFTPREGLELYVRYRAVFSRPPDCSPFRRLLWRIALRPPGRRGKGGEAPTGMILLVVLLSLSPMPLHGQTGSDELMDAARQAVEAENYALAMERIEEGTGRYPEDFRFPDMAGDLYYREGLFESARQAWQEALRRGAPSYPVRYDLSRTLGRLNRDVEAIALLERLYEEVPEDTYVVDDLAWLYYKQNRLDDARRLLEDALQEGGAERDLTMTLATVYAGMYRYDDARQAYRRAVAVSDPEERHFRSVAHYNEAILHARFRVWEEAEESVRKSLEMVERSAGYMMRSELRLQRLDIEGAILDLERAVRMEDDSPLPGLSLASALLEAGDTARARTLVDRVGSHSQDGWLYFYGTSPERYLYQLYTTMADTWEVTARRERLYRPGTVWQRTGQYIRSVFHRVKGWYYRGLARLQSLSVAEEFASGGRRIQASVHRMIAGEKVPSIALANMRIAEELEVPQNPAIAANYRMSRGIVTNDAKALEDLLSVFDGPWERYDRLRILVELYDLMGRSSPRGLHHAAEAWMLHRGAFLVRGHRVPMNIVGPRRGRIILRRLGIAHVPESPLTLHMEWRDGRLEWRVDLTGEGTVSEGDVVSLDRRGRPVGGQHSTARYRKALEELAGELVGTVGRNSLYPQ
jgi:transglutaminase-like putative cysteine protease/tetratricopeptide (TPR) repeat protein